ncbi:MAG: L-threonylcarbamoyladenylate synthase, partial [Acidobacteriota bacterium]
ANPSGFPPARTAVEVEYAFPVRLGAGCLVLDGGPTTGESPSTMVDLCSGRPRLIRRGAVSYEEVIEALGGWRRSSGS